MKLNLPKFAVFIGLIATFFLLGKVHVADVPRAQADDDFIGCMRGIVLYEDELKVEDGKAKASFKLDSECQQQTVTLATYELLTPFFSLPQKIHDHVSGVFDGNPDVTYTLEADMPDCFYQVDLVMGDPILEGDPWYNNRMVQSLVGGEACPESPPPSPTPAPSPTPSPEPSPSPSPEPSPSPAPSPSPSPTPIDAGGPTDTDQGGGGGGGGSGGPPPTGIYPEDTVAVTPSPTPTPAPAPQVKGADLPRTGFGWFQIMNVILIGFEIFAIRKLVHSVAFARRK